jgi:acyl-CoA synthetase (AMP-forming)/AMP-acid ligase II
MHPTHHARTTPDKPALVMAGSGAVRTYAQLEAGSNRAAHLFRAMGLGAGEVVALMLENRPEFFEIVWGAQRAGLHFVCISTRLTPTEIAYIVADSGARAFITSDAFAPVLETLRATLASQRFMLLGAARPGWEDWRALCDAQPTTPIADEGAGADMLYSSGTTGRPKGVRAALTGAAIDAPNPLLSLMMMLYGVHEDTIYLSPAPLYHAAPLRWTMSIHRAGGTVVCMEHFDAEAMLAAIARHRVDTVQMVPTMFVRLLKLPEAVRAAADVSSLRAVIHAAAPCPIPVKQAMIDWWGPIIHEYYAGTEGNGFVACTAAEWLAHPGTVGRALLGTVRICDDEGNELPVGEAGTVWFADGPAFEYHNDPERTAASRHPVHPGWSTLGDIGRLDPDGYLHLTDRKAFKIITGGVNVYPQEVENLLVTHPKVADVAVFGVPDPEFGESVKAVVQPLDMAAAGPALAAELMAFCRTQLSPIKCPRSIDFEAELPRHPTGKLYKRVLRDRYLAAAARAD